MRLDRNVTDDHEGKYALVLLRNLRKIRAAGDREKNIEIHDALQTLEEYGLLDYGTANAREFFVMRYSDMFTLPALRAYRDAVMAHAEQFGDQPGGLLDYVNDLNREILAANQYLCKVPD